MSAKKKRRRLCWRSLLFFPALWITIVNIFFHAGISKVESDANNVNAAIELKPPSQSQPSISKITTLAQEVDPYFSREPLLHRGCTLQFVDQTMAFCFSGGTLDQEIGQLIARRLLEYHFRCSANEIPVIDVTKESRQGRKCVWIQSVVANAESEDVVWDTMHTVETAMHTYSYRSPANPALLIADLFQDYYWLPTQNVAKEPHFFKGRRCLIDYTERPRNKPFRKQRYCANVRLSTQQPFLSFLEDLRLCDVVASNDLTPLILADSLGIPNLAMDPSKQEEYMNYIKGTNRSLDGWSNRLDLRPPPKAEREALSVKIAESFPYHLIQPSKPIEKKADLKTLVIIMGNIRGGDVTWNTFYKHMLDLNSADLALVIGQVPKEKQTSSLFQRAKYLYEFPEFHDWGEAVDQINGSAWRPFILPDANDLWGTWGGVAGKAGSGAIIFMARWYVAKFLVENNLLGQYDRFVLTRSDHYYGCDHDLSLLDNEYMWLPRGEDYTWGITDRHLICNKGQILKALDIYPSIVKHPERYVSPQFADFVPERLLRLRWEQENLWPWIRRFDRVMFTCAIDGDTTRWTEMSQHKVKEGVFLKYEYEYEETTCICKTGPCDFPYTKRKKRVGYPQRDQKLVW